MQQNRAQEVLYESEAALRLVDHELHQLHDLCSSGSHASLVDDANGASHAAVVHEANAQIMAALIRLRERSAAHPLSEAADLLHEMERRMTDVQNLLEGSNAPSPDATSPAN